MKVKEYFLFILCLFLIGNPWLVAFSAAENTIQFSVARYTKPKIDSYFVFSKPNAPTHHYRYFSDYVSSNTDPNWASYSHTSGGANPSTS